MARVAKNGSLTSAASSEKRLTVQILKMVQRKIQRKRGLQKLLQQLQLLQKKLLLPKKKLRLLPKKRKHLQKIKNLPQKKKRLLQSSLLLPLTLTTSLVVIVVILQLVVAEPREAMVAITGTPEHGQSRLSTLVRKFVRVNTMKESIVRNAITVMVMVHHTRM